MSSAPRYVPRYTYEDYRLWEGDWQLIDGVAIAMSPSPFGPHERAASRIGMAFASAVARAGCQCEVYFNLDWVVDEHTVVRPDVMLVCGEQPERHLQRPPEVAVEVLSPSTRQLDLTVKRELYIRSGVLYYVIADPEERRFEFVDIRSKVDPPPTAELNGLRLSLPDGCDLRVDLSGVFR